VPSAHDETDNISAARRMAVRVTGTHGDNPRAIRPNASRTAASLSGDRRPERHFNASALSNATRAHSAHTTVRPSDENHAATDDEWTSGNNNAIHTLVST